MIETILKCMLGARWKTAIFSVTSACNCRCSMCNIPNLPPKNLPIDAAFELLRQCVENKVAFLSLTGGEPFLHPHLPALVKRAHDLGIFVHIATNGTLPDRVDEVKGHVDAIGFSIDSHVSSEHDQNRGHAGAFEKCLKSVGNCKKLGIRSFANTPPNRYIIEKIEEYVRFVNDEVGIPVGFCYPETNGGEYFSKCNSIISGLRNEQIADFFSAALRLKKMGYDIINTDIFLHEAIAYAKGNFSDTSRCGSGRVVYWIDWSGKVHPCFKKRTVLNRNKSWEKYNPFGCNDCFVQCFREPSSFVYHLPFSLNDLKTWKRFLVKKPSGSK
ncbi:MAG: radical SAM protein [Candidatus Hadarchaeum sp.]|uniref:radical SAM protein n=1 Tax=Candidatus Hadarchaeum sp. TaxID=2883567 RepID=UPI003177FAB4